MYGLGDAYSYSDVIQKIIDDIEKRQLKLFKDGYTTEAKALDETIAICKIHQQKGYG